jgi:hypothetical protein
LKKAMGKTGFSYKTLREDKYVASNLSIRMDRLVWRHHQIVAPLSGDQQKYKKSNYKRSHKEIKQFGNTCASRYGVVLADGPVPLLSTARDDTWHPHS